MLEKILRAEPIDWDLLSSYILKQKHNPKQHQRNSSILLAVVKTQDVPLHIVQSLILPSSTSTGNRINLKTLRNAFECSCRCSSARVPRDRSDGAGSDVARDRGVRGNPGAAAGLNRFDALAATGHIEPIPPERRRR